MIDLSAGAPVWFGNASVTMNSLILPAAGVAELQILQWETKGSLLVLMAAVGWQDFHERDSCLSPAIS